MNLRRTLLKQIHKRHPHAVRYHSYRTTQKVLILFESDTQERNVQIKALARQLQEDGKLVTAWGFVPQKKQAESAVLRDYRVLAHKDYSFWGTPMKSIRNQLKNEHFDLLIDLNINGLLELDYLNIYADADFRAGQLTSDPEFCDFMIDLQEEKNPAFLFDQIVHYLQIVEEA